MHPFVSSDLKLILFFLSTDKAKSLEIRMRSYYLTYSHVLMTMIAYMIKKASIYVWTLIVLFVG